MINNAGVYSRVRRNTVGIINNTMNTNYWNTVAFTREMFIDGAMAENAKVIMVSSGLGKLSKLEKRNPAIMEELSTYKSGDLTIERLNEIAKQTHDEMKDNQKAKNWPGSVYGLSKLYLSIWVRTSTFSIFNSFRSIFSPKAKNTKIKISRFTVAALDGARQI